MPIRVCIAREHLKSIQESAKPELEDRIDTMGLRDDDWGYHVAKNWIDHANGTHIFFIGLSTVSEEDIKGLSQVDVLWNEEGHTTSHRSWELIDPTIRSDDAEIWVSFNPRFRTDAIWQVMERNRLNPRYWMRHVTYQDNVFFAPRNERQRQDDERDNPSRYAHIWEGQPDDASDRPKVLPYELLMACVKAWDKRPQPKGAFRTAGLDLADTGADKNCLAMRSGPELYRVDTWHGSEEWTPTHTARHAAEQCGEEGATRLMYDVVGMGAGIRGTLREAGHAVDDGSVPVRRQGARAGRGVHQGASGQDKCRILRELGVAGRVESADACGEHASVGGERPRQPRGLSFHQSRHPVSGGCSRAAGAAGTR